MMTSSKKTCKVCRKKIKNDDKWVSLMTHEGEKCLEKVFFHFGCFLNWFNDRVNKHADMKITKSAPIALKKVINAISGNKFDSIKNAA